MAGKKLSKKNYDYDKIRLYAGQKNGSKRGMSLWYTSSDGRYRPTFVSKEHRPARTPLGLLKECRSTIQDLLKNHPELGMKL